MEITHKMSFSELSRLGGDKDLVPILQARGMLLDNDLRPLPGSHFHWEDFNGYRVFIWRGSAEAAIAAAQQHVEQVQALTNTSIQVSKVEALPEIPVADEVIERKIRFQD